MIHDRQADQVLACGPFPGRLAVGPTEEIRAFAPPLLAAGTSRQGASWLSRRRRRREASMPDELREFATSSNGDRWLIARDEETGSAFVVHKANRPSGGAVT